ncbi:rab-GTPase-TBC domain-containing protein [Hyaloraphidium curvatum]|nr:rab-GTPase-TBC domain-containing protein [Hyaloraphidium curvatum]
MSASESPGSPGTASTSDLPPLPPSPTTPEDSDAVESPQGYPTDNSLDEDGSARDEIPAHVLRQIELLNLEVESDPKSIWFDKLIYAPASILDHAATTRTIGSRRKREPSSSMTLLDLPPPADLEVMFGWPPPNGDGDETPEKESVWSEWQDGAVPAPIAHGPAHRELVLRGPPPSARPDVWGTLAAVAELGIGTLYKQLKEDHSPFDKLISRDVPRTFPKLGMFREDSGPGQELLGSILRAYSLYDGEVGYCQGMSFVVAGMLIVGLTELDSFSMLVRLMEGFPPFFRGTPEVVRRPSGALRRSHYAYPLRHLYTPGMPLLHALLHLLTHFASETMPEVQKHLEDAGLEPATWASQWFLTLFTYSFPRFVWERTWDMCFAEVSDEGDHGDQPADGAAPEASRASPASNAKPRKTYFLPRTLLIAALAALQHVKPRLLEANDPEVLLQLLRGDRICNTFADCEAVVDQASSWYNESSFVPVDQVRKKMREFWRSIVDRVASRGTSPAEGDAAREEKQPEVVAAPETDNRSNVAPAVRQQSSFTFGLFRGRGARNDEQDLKQALMEARRRAEEAESRAELLSHQLDVMAARQHDAPLAGQELDEPMMDGSDGWRAEKEMWREEVLRLGRVVDAREAEMVR